MSTDVDHDYSYQVRRSPVGSPETKCWVTLQMLPPGIGTAEFEEGWIAYLQYLKVVHPEEEYRLIKTTVTRTSEVIDV